MTIADDIVYVGVNDHEIDLFEGQYVVPRGMAYNSYLVKDEKTAVLDTVDQRFFEPWMKNIRAALGDRPVDFLVVHHMEPDHSANIAKFLAAYPDCTVVSSALAFKMMEQFFGTGVAPKRRVVKEGDTLVTGRHTFAYVAAPMVHWPEVMVSYDTTDKILFSADGFGKFGANDVEDPEGWDCEARRYFIGIVGKFGQPVQDLLKKAAGLEIRKICPLHGPVLDTPEAIGHAVKLYDTWSGYAVETPGVTIAYTSVYGHTKEAALKLAETLKSRGRVVKVFDLARDDQAEAVESAFETSHLVLATTTYNSNIFPWMRHFIDHLVERNYQKRTVGLIENGSWSPMAARTMTGMLASCKDLTLLPPVTLRGALNDASEKALEALADALCPTEKPQTLDVKAMFKVGYGLYVLTARENGKDNGCIINTFQQVTDTPLRVSVTVNKANLTCEMIQHTGLFNISVLAESAPFDLFRRFGFQSGRKADKFAGFACPRLGNGVLAVARNTNAIISAKVTQTIDLGTHLMFIADVTDAVVKSSEETTTYSYYQRNIKPQPQSTQKKGWRCIICGYFYEGETLPPDFVCPLCKHGANDFERVG